MLKLRSGTWLAISGSFLRHAFVDVRQWWCLTLDSCHSFQISCIPTQHIYSIGSRVSSSSGDPLFTYLVGTLFLLNFPTSTTTKPLESLIISLHHCYVWAMRSIALWRVSSHIWYLNESGAYSELFFFFFPLSFIISTHDQNVECMYSVALRGLFDESLTFDYQSRTKFNFMLIKLSLTIALNLKKWYV